MCNKKASLHSCGHQGSVDTTLCPDATFRVDPTLSNVEAATFDAACDTRPETNDRDYCCDQKCCSRQLKITYDAYRKAGAAKGDFPEPSFMQRSMTGKPKASYLAKKEEVLAAFLKAQAEHDAAKKQHAGCRLKQDEASAKRRAESDRAKLPIAEQEKGKTPSRRQVKQQRLERAIRRRFGEVPELDERKDSYFPQMPRITDAYDAEMPTSTRRRPPPPPPIMSYGAPQEEHEWVREGLPRIAPGSWSEQSRSRKPSSTINASGNNDSTTQNSYNPPVVLASNEPFADEYAGCVGNASGVIRPRFD